MKVVWNVTTYIRSEMPLTDKVPSVMSITFVVIDDNPPTDELIIALVSAHTRNCEPLMSEVHRSEIPADFL